MNWTERQTPIEIWGTLFPRFKNSDGNPTERFWYVKDEFIKNSRSLLAEARIFSSISARRKGARWVAVGKAVESKDIASLIWKMRLFYMKTESMSIYSLCTYMEENVANERVQLFFKHMRESWEKSLGQPATFLDGYSGYTQTNKQLIDTVLYAGHFHSQEKYKRRYDDLLAYMDESLILMSVYNAMHSGYQMNQISRSLSELREDYLVIHLPDHLQHEWDPNCPYEVIR